MVGTCLASEEHELPSEDGLKAAVGRQENAISTPTVASPSPGMDEV